MLYLKKLAFAPLFLASLAYSIYLYKDFLNSYDLVFSFSSDSLVKLAVFAGCLILTSLFFVVFAALSQDWKLVGPVSLLGAVLSFVFLPLPLSVVIAVTLLISLLITFLMLENRLKTYVTFQATALLNPSIKSLTLFFILIFSFGYFLNINSKIQKEGSEIPDSLIDFSLKFAMPSEGPNFKREKYLAQLPQLSPEQIQLLKQNPELLKQYGIDPKMLDSLEKQQNSKAPSKKSNQSVQIPTTSGNLSNDFIKKLLKDQFQTLLKPYLGIIPAVLALVFFVSIQFMSSLLSILVSPAIWLVFYILERSGFITFTKEMREVKKMVV